MGEISKTQLRKAERKVVGSWICTSKIKYQTRKKAWSAALYTYINRGVLCGVYTCQYCNKFHLTHKFDGTSIPLEFRQGFNEWYGQEVFPLDVSQLPTPHKGVDK